MITLNHEITSECKILHTSHCISISTGLDHDKGLQECGQHFQDLTAIPFASKNLLNKEQTTSQLTFNASYGEQSKEMTKEEKLLNDTLYEQQLHFPIKYSKSLNTVKKPHTHKRT
jgi:hypothetical protein